MAKSAMSHSARLPARMPTRSPCLISVGQQSTGTAFYGVGKNLVGPPPGTVDDGFMLWIAPRNLVEQVRGRTTSGFVHYRESINQLSPSRPSLYNRILDRWSSFFLPIHDYLIAVYADWK